MEYKTPGCSCKGYTEAVTDARKYREKLFDLFAAGSSILRATTNLADDAPCGFPAAMHTTAIATL